MTRPVFILAAITLALLSLITYELARTKYRLQNPHPGYLPVNVKALGSIGLTQQATSASEIPPWVQALDGKKVYLEGEEWTANSTYPNELELVYTLHRSEHVPPVAEEFIACKLPTPPPPVYPGLVGISGTLHIKLELGPNQKLQRIYRLTVDTIEPLP